MKIDRRDFLKLAGIGGAVLVSGLGNPIGLASAAVSREKSFLFFQLSDTHWGFNGPKVNPDFAGTLKKAIAAVNSPKGQPDFIIFTGDLTHTTDDDKERRERLAGFRDIVAGLKIKNVKFMPGEHDAGLDEGKAYKEFFGETHYVFDHKGVHFIVLDNVSDPRSMLGEAQLEWLSADLKRRDKNLPIVVFAHRPLFDLYPDWDWHTRDGAKAVELLMPYRNVIVFYGHIHQVNYHTTGHIAHHSAKGLMYALPAPGSVPVKNPIPWDSSQPYKGLGFRSIDRTDKARYVISEFNVNGGRS